jgi:hypothetical protein
MNTELLTILKDIKEACIEAGITTSDDLKLDVACRIYNSSTMQKNAYSKPKISPTMPQNRGFKPITPGQVSFLKALKFTGDTSKMSSSEASKLIKELNHG